MTKTVRKIITALIFSVALRCITETSTGLGGNAQKNMHFGQNTENEHPGNKIQQDQITPQNPMKRILGKDGIKGVQSQTTKINAIKESLINSGIPGLIKAKSQIVFGSGKSLLETSTISKRFSMPLLSRSSYSLNEKPISKLSFRSMTLSKVLTNSVKNFEELQNNFKTEISKSSLSGRSQTFVSKESHRILSNSDSMVQDLIDRQISENMNQGTSQNSVDFQTSQVMLNSGVSQATQKLGGDLKSQNSKTSQVSQKTETMSGSQKSGPSQVSHKTVTNNGSQKNSQVSQAKSQTSSVRTEFQAIVNDAQVWLKSVIEKSNESHSVLHLQANDQIDFTNICHKVKLETVEYWIDDFYAKKFITKTFGNAQDFANQKAQETEIHGHDMIVYSAALGKFKDKLVNYPFLFVSIRLRSLVKFYQKMLEMADEYKDKNFEYPSTVSQSFYDIVNVETFQPEALEGFSALYRQEKKFIAKHQTLDGTQFAELNGFYGDYKKQLKVYDYELCRTLDFIVMCYAQHPQAVSSFKKIIDGNFGDSDEKATVQEHIETFFVKFQDILEGDNRPADCGVDGSRSIHSTVSISWISEDINKKLKTGFFFTEQLYDDLLESAGEDLTMIEFDSFLINFRTTGNVLEDIYEKTSKKFIFHLDFINDFENFPILRTKTEIVYSVENTKSFIIDLWESDETNSQDLQRIGAYRDVLILVYKIYIRLRTIGVINDQNASTENIYETMYQYMYESEKHTQGFFAGVVDADDFDNQFLNVIAYLCGKRPQGCNNPDKSEVDRVIKNQNLHPLTPQPENKPAIGGWRLILPPGYTKLLKEVVYGNIIDAFFENIIPLFKDVNCDSAKDPFVIQESQEESGKRRFVYSKACTQSEFEIFVTQIEIVLRSKLTPDMIDRFFIRWNQFISGQKGESKRFYMYLMIRYLKKMETDKTKISTIENFKRFAYQWFGSLDDVLVNRADIERDAGLYMWSFAVLGPENTKTKSFIPNGDERDYLMTDLYYMNYQASLKVGKEDNRFKHMTSGLETIFQTLNDKEGEKEVFNDFVKNILYCRPLVCIKNGAFMDTKDEQCNQNTVGENSYAFCNFNFVVKMINQLITLDILMDASYLFDLYNHFSSTAIEKFSSGTEGMHYVPETATKQFTSIYHHIYLSRKNVNTLVDIPSGIYLLYGIRKCMFYEENLESASSNKKRIFGYEASVCLMARRQYAEIQWIVRYFVNLNRPGYFSQFFGGADRSYPAQFGPFFNLIMKYKSIQEDIQAECINTKDTDDDSLSCMLYQAASYLISTFKDDELPLNTFAQTNQKLIDIFGFKTTKIQFKDSRIITLAAFEAMFFVFKHQPNRVDIIKSSLRGNNYFKDINSQLNVNDDTITDSAFVIKKTNGQYDQDDVNIFIEYLRISFSKRIHDSRETHYTRTLKEVINRETSDLKDVIEQRENSLLDKMLTFHAHKRPSLIKIFLEAGSTITEFKKLTHWIISSEIYLDVVTIDRSKGETKKVKQEFLDIYSERKTKYDISEMVNTLKDLIDKYFEEEELHDIQWEHDAYHFDEDYIDLGEDDQSMQAESYDYMAYAVKGHSQVIENVKTLSKGIISSGQSITQLLIQQTEYEEEIQEHIVQEFNMDYEMVSSSKKGSKSSSIRKVSSYIGDDFDDKQFDEVVDDDQQEDEIDLDSNSRLISEARHSSMKHLGSRSKLENGGVLSNGRMASYSQLLVNNAQYSASVILQSQLTLPDRLSSEQKISIAKSLTGSLSKDSLRDQNIVLLQKDMDIVFKSQADKKIDTMVNLKDGFRTDNNKNRNN